MPHNTIMVVNSGSSSVKFSLFASNGHCIAKGSLTGIGTHPELKAKGALLNDEEHRPSLKRACRNTSEGVHSIVDWLDSCLPKAALKAVGHRVVHGGEFHHALRIEPSILKELRALVPLAPLHQPYNLEAIDMIAQVHPDVPQVACFDTSFHSHIPDLHRRIPLPRAWHDKGVKRYGFHGLSYNYIAGRLRDISPHAFSGNTIIAHLGNGSSLCALKAGKSFDTSMGFSTLDGLMMGTRPGGMDVGVILYLLREAKMDVKGLEKLLYKESGLLGVSGGISSDMATLLASKAPEANEAVDLYCHRVARESGALISVMGGVDAFVFTGGIGEHAVEVRRRIMAKLHWAGFDLDDKKNAVANGSKSAILSTAKSAKEIHVIPTDEELVIARQTREALAR